MMNNLEFVKWAHSSHLAENCARRHRIVNYRPGHVRYQFGHYPCRKPYHPDERDWKLLDLYAEKGVQVIHLWQWKDSLGLYAKHLYDPMNPAGAQLFIDECHRRNLKVIPYTSPGFVDVRHPDYQPGWDSLTPRLKEVYYDLARMCPGSPGWRKYFFGAIANLMDNFGFDGIYWDAGSAIGCSNPAPDGHVHFKEFAPFKDGLASHLDHKQENELFRRARRDPEMAFTHALTREFYAEIHALVRSRDGITVAHIGGDVQSPFKEKLWDYQLLGEGRSDIDGSLNITRYYDPYVLRFVDWSRLVTNHSRHDFTPDFSKVPHIEHHVFSASIPYMQFPFLEDGNYGEREDVQTVPGVQWIQGFDVWTEWRKAQERAGLPPVGGASFIAGRDRYFKYLAFYRQMVKPNTLAFLELAPNIQLPAQCAAEGMATTIFINDYLWIAVYNGGLKAAEVKFGSIKGAPNYNLLVPSKRLAVFKYADMVNLPEAFTSDRI